MAGGCSLVEQLKNIFQGVFGEAYALIDDFKSRLLILPSKSQQNFAIGRAELQCVVQQVPDDLLDTGAVGLHIDRFPIGRQRQPNTSAALLIASYGADTLQHGAQIDRLGLQFEFARADARYIEQVIDDPRLAGDRFANDVDRFARHAGTCDRWYTSQDIGIELNQVQRVLELVGHHCEELVLHVAGAL
ncbi:hypothetical protein D3C81_1120160 [compost metagenome]